jgi:hypothetical protein
VVWLAAYSTGDGMSEPSTSGRFTIKREGDLSANLEIGYAVSGTATPGVDYGALSGKVVILAGETSADVPVNPIDDTELEGDESVTLSITNAVGWDSAAPAQATRQ